MKTLALIILLPVVVAVPSFTTPIQPSNITTVEKLNKPRQPYRGGGRRELYPTMQEV
ncbi:MAG TPA: hypothetical protein VK203_12755 [Nostocaceae cyanobacterium]|nr:hypothetical protein [Nostocaceae cyanobacterium]